MYGYEVSQLMNRTGYEIFEMCDGGNTIGEILKKMMMRYQGISRERIENDLNKALIQLTSMGAITWKLPKWKPYTSWVMKLDGVDGRLALCDDMSGTSVERFLRATHYLNKKFRCADGNVLLDPFMNGSTIIDSQEMCVAYLSSCDSIRVLIGISVQSLDKDEAPAAILSRLVVAKEKDMYLLSKIVQYSFNMIREVIESVSQRRIERDRVWIDNNDLEENRKWSSLLAEVGFSEECVLKDETPGGNIWSFVRTISVETK